MNVENLELFLNPEKMWSVWSFDVFYLAKERQMLL